MYRTLLASKIHNCTLTKTNINYVGSISIDQSLLTAAGILAYEQVQVVNVNNGERLITYAIPAPADSGAVELNGAAARLGVPGDLVIIMTYAQLSREELEGFKPLVILVDHENHALAD
ncbi:MAG: aspartate 1-decarboxylase [Acaryochloridaceae cyanobacterium SU_2_1]|nr:aspartate 1-decarboxylase [Acaryochloridaceae cyanobacterium SU_2_1]